MQAKPKSLQAELFKTSLAKIINIRHPLCILGAKIKWHELDKTFGPLYSEGRSSHCREREEEVNGVSEEVVEAVIGHAKTERRLGRNYFLGAEGGENNAILSGCGYNMRKLLRSREL